MARLPLLSRLAVVGVLALGLVGMHHLVIAACHHLGASETTSMTAPMYHDHTDHGMSAPEAPQPADQAPTPGGLLGAAAMCLAILLLFVLVLGPRAWAHLRRMPSAQRLIVGVAQVSALARPPDLTLLSVSRT